MEININLIKILFVSIFIFILSSCASTKYIDKPVYIEKPVVVETVKTEYINQYYQDSTYVHDSVEKFTQNDTVFKIEYKYVYKYLNRIDTVIKTDTIEVPINVEVPVEIKSVEVLEVNRLKWYQEALMWIGGVVTLIIIGYIIYKVKLK